MSSNAEKLQDAIGQVREEYVLEAHGCGQLQDKGQTRQEAKATPHMEALHGQQAQATAPSKKRGRYALAGLAIAACLVVAFVGVFGMMNTISSLAPNEAAETVETEGDATSAREAASADYMAGEEAAGSADGAGSMISIGNPATNLPSADAAEAFVLTACEWNDNDNWPFFTNLVNAGEIQFPSFGINPVNRVKVTVKNAAGEPARGETVVLRDGSGGELWRAQSDKSGVAYLFFDRGDNPVSVDVGGVRQDLIVESSNPEDLQGFPESALADDVDIVVGSSSTAASDGVQVMFILDATGSMADELAYLQKDFSSIAAEIGSEGTSYSVNFYRDEGDDYVTKCNEFTDDVDQVQSKLNAEMAAGGGDRPEAVGQVLQETVTDNGQWRDGCAKVAFLVFDAPPHDSAESQIDEAVRSAAERGIRLVPVVASNAERDTELFGRALAICTDGTYVFLTDDSGVGDSHLQPIVGDCPVESLHDIIVRIIQNA